MKSTLAILSVCLLLFRTGECAVVFTFPAGDTGFVNLNAEATTIATLASSGATGALTYAITAQSTADTFQIATATSGAITLKGSSVLTTTISQHVLSVSISDAGSSTSDTAKLFITVNIATPTYNATDYCVDISATLAIDSIIGIWEATDADAGTTLTYSLSAANTLFELSSTGVVTSKIAILASHDPSYTLIMLAKDTGATKTGTGTLTILREGTCPSPSCSGATVLSAAVVTTAGALAMLLFF